MQHLDDGALHAWLDRDRSGISEREATAIQAHLGVCQACAARLAEARSLAERSRAILARSAPSVVPPAFAEIRARAAAGHGPMGATPRRPWVPITWAASVVLAVGLGWFGREVIPNQPTASDPSGAAAVATRLAASAPSSSEVEALRPVPTAAESTGATGEGARAGGASIPAPPSAQSGVAAPSRESAEETLSIARTTFDDRVPPADGPEAVASLPPPPAGSRPVALRGQVTDPQGAPLSSAQISIAGLTAGAVSDSTGHFALSLPPSASAAGNSLLVTARRLGYEEGNVEIGVVESDSLWADVRLEPTALTLQAIVATGLVDPIEDATRPSASPPWIPVDPDEAARSFGAPVLLIPGLPVLELGIGRLDGARAVRVTQEHPDGRLTYVQVRAEESVDPGDAAAATGTVSVLVEGVRLTGAGSLPTDTIRALLERVR